MVIAHLSWMFESSLQGVLVFRKACLLDSYPACILPTILHVFCLYTICRFACVCLALWLQFGSSRTALLIESYKYVYKGHSWLFEVAFSALLYLLLIVVLRLAT